MLQTANQRIYYIDAIKGFSILWVIIFHLGDMPSWLTVPYRMPLFFFISGIFFRQKPFKQFFVRRVNTLVIPFFFFLFVTLIICAVKYNIIGTLFPQIEHEGSLMTGIVSFLAFFNFCNEDIHAPLALNIPLWFLIALFNIQMIFYAVSKIKYNVYFLFSVSLALHIASIVLLHYGINGLFYLATTLQYFIYYVAGNILGPKLMKFIEKRENEWIILGLSFPLLSVLSLTGYNGENVIIQNFLINIRIACFILLVFVFFKRFYGLVLLKPLSFFGRNSLILLCSHVLIISNFGAIFVKTLHIFAAESSSYKFVLFFIIITANYFFIIFFNKYLPWFVGKKELITI